MSNPRVLDRIFRSQWFRPCWRILRPNPIFGLGLALGTITATGVFSPTAQALEAVQLTHGEQASEPIPLEDLESFAFSGVPSKDIQILLDILRVEEDLAQEFLTHELPVDLQSIREASDTFIGATFWRLVGTAISLNDTTGQAWEHVRDALLSAAADDRITLLEVLQNVEAGLLVIDAQRLSFLSSPLGLVVEASQNP